LVKRAILIYCCLGWSFGVWAGSGASAFQSIVTYRTNDIFESVKENVEDAIIGRGMVIGRTLHVREMLDRTGPDLGFPRSIYLQAVALEFCSASISHRMLAVDPVNIVVCPFTIAVYVKTDDPNTVFVSFRQPELVSDDGSIAFDIFSLLDGIAREAIE
jgi:uncharacterized protein (DUF302 family)